MKVQEVILKAMAGSLKWWEAAEIIGVSDRTMRRWRERYQEGGYDGLYVELTKPAWGCRASTLWFAPRVEHVAYEERFMRPGDVARIWIIDVGGKRVVIDTIHPADASAEKVAQTTRMVETATFMTVE